MGDLDNSLKPTQLLEKLSKKSILSLYHHEIPDSIDKAVPKKKDLIIKIARWMEEGGVKTFIESLKRDELKSASTGCELKWEKDDNKNSKSVLTRKLYEKIMKMGFDNYLEKHGNKNLLNIFSDVLDIEIEEDTEKEDLRKQIAAAVRAFGMETFFWKFDTSILLEIMKELNLKTRGSNSKRKLVEAIVANKSIKKEPVKKKGKLSYSKTKKPIEEGITYDDIFQHYYVEEIREYCKAHGLKSAGKKKC